MTKDNIEEYWPLLEALRDGKTVQLNTEAAGWIDLPSVVFNYLPGDYRIKPEPKLRPWKPEEVPVGALARVKGSSERTLIVTVSQRDGEWMIYGGRYNDKGDTFNQTPEVFFHRWEHSLDHGKTWKSCGVVE